ncbi:MAG: hypothetical protein NUV97_03660 [archaeon]|nr:hypothetical protein [archaeon]MCR4323886.1 hypothetical protein [Nanoarchaeota archaeon]
MQTINKKAISAVVEVSLLILITVSLAGIIYMPLRGMVDEPLLSPEISCSNQAENPLIGMYACYNQETKKIEIEVVRKSGTIASLKFQVSKEGNTDSYSCGSGCSTCELVGSTSDSKIYYIPLSEKPDSISIITNECEGTENEILNC